MAEPRDKGRGGSGAAPKRRRKVLRIVLLVLVVLIVAAAFELKIIKIPECYPDIQEEVDWPPEEFGFYEESTHNRLRPLEAAAWSPPNVVSVCNVSGAPAAQTVATVPASPRFLVFQQDVTGYQYHFYHSVEVPDTFECVNVQRANEAQGLVVTPEADNPQMVWITPPSALDQGQTYMLTAGADVVKGLVVTVGTAQ